MIPLELMPRGTARLKFDGGDWLEIPQLLRGMGRVLKKVEGEYPGGRWEPVEVSGSVGYGYRRCGDDAYWTLMLEWGDPPVLYLAAHRADLCNWVKGFPGEKKVSWLWRLLGNFKK